MIDLSRSGYLGFCHTPDELRPWEQFSTGRPAAADNIAFIDELEFRLADLVGCEAAVTAPSTLHVFWDLLTALVDDEIAVYLDDGAYHIARWGVEAVAAHGVRVEHCSHHQPDDLRQRLNAATGERVRPVVILDGISRHTWRPGPLREFVNAVEASGGLLVVDDTQAVGLLGRPTVAEDPFGAGGGGSLRWHEIESPHVLLVSSLTKGFGVPVAVLAGNRQLIDWFRSISRTRAHCSPPSTAAMCAVDHALDQNETRGDELRRQLALNIQHFQSVLPGNGAAGVHPPFPVQIIGCPAEVDPFDFDAELRSRGVQTLLRANDAGGAELVCIILATHTVDDVDEAAGTIASVLHDHVTNRSPCTAGIDGDDR